MADFFAGTDLWIFFPNAVATVVRCLEVKEGKEVSCGEDIIAILNTRIQLVLGCDDCAILLAIKALHNRSRGLDFFARCKRTIKSFEVDSLDPFHRFLDLCLGSFIGIQNRVLRVSCSQLGQGILDDRLKVDLLSLGLDRPSLNHEQIHVGLAAIVIVVGFIVVPANALVRVTSALPAALGIVVYRQINQGLVFLREPMIDATVDQAALLVDASK